VTFAVCLGACSYCGNRWCPIIETDEHGGFSCELECPRCGGRRTGHVRLVAGFEPTEEQAIARAESWGFDDH
jgi:hypothetical protein